MREVDERKTKDCFVKTMCSRAWRGRRHGRVKCDSGETGRYEVEYIVLLVCLGISKVSVQLGKKIISYCCYFILKNAPESYFLTCFTVSQVISSQKEMKNDQHHTVVDLCGYCLWSQWWYNGQFINLRLDLCSSSSLSSQTQSWRCICADVWFDECNSM